jgi:hypothetical protein
MNISYTIRGGDGKEYGPASLEDLSMWVREGRVNRQTEVRRSDMEHWAPAGQFTELQGAFPPEVLPPVAPAGVAQGADPVLLKQVKSGASWFFTVAALSMINSIASACGSDWRFLFGLGITQIFDAIGRQVGGSGRFVTLGLDVLVAALFVAFGIFGGKRHLWAFIVGMVLLLLDGVLMLVSQDWIGAGFHAFVLFWLFAGTRACLALKKSSPA